MNISIKKHVNTDENNRVEFLLANYDYFDGNDLLSDLFHKKFGFKVGEKLDGIYYSIQKLYSEDTEYNLVWHEDVGNYIYSTQQDEKTLHQLEDRLKFIITDLNSLTNKQN